MMTTGLTEAQQNFCWEFAMNGGNAMAAYVIAYPNANKKTASAAAYRFRHNPEMVALIKQITDDMYAARMLTAEKIAEEIALVAFQRRELDFDNYNEGTKLKALDLLQKQLGLQTQRVEANVNTSIIINILDEDDDAG